MIKEMLIWSHHDSKKQEIFVAHAIYIDHQEPAIAHLAKIVFKYLTITVPLLITA